MFQTVFISKVIGSNSLPPSGAQMNRHTLSTCSLHWLLDSHSIRATASVCVSAIITLTLFRKRTDVFLWLAEKNKTLTRLPPHSFLGSVFVTETVRIHNKDWHSWNVQSRPGYVGFFLFFVYSLPPITKASVSQQWLLCLLQEWNQYILSISQV